MSDGRTESEMPVVGRQSLVADQGRTRRYRRLPSGSRHRWSNLARPVACTLEDYAAAVLHSAAYQMLGPLDRRNNRLCGHRLDALASPASPTSYHGYHPLQSKNTGFVLALIIALETYLHSARVPAAASLS